MPELPEVENIRRYLLRSRIVGRRIVKASVEWPRMVKSADFEGFVTGVIGRRIAGVDRHGKYLSLPLDTGWLGLHMGMTGSVRVAAPVDPPERFIRAEFRLDDDRRIELIDPRKWASLWLAGDPSEITGGLGPDATDPAVTRAVFTRTVKRRAAPIKQVLLDQATIAGIGNIYADEALFIARIDPRRRAATISEARLGDLYEAIHTSLNHALRHIEEHPMSDGRPYVVDAYDDRMRLPRREGSPCPRCSKQLRRHAFGNRSSYYCPGCQR